MIDYGSKLWTSDGHGGVREAAPGDARSGHPLSWGGNIGKIGAVIPCHPARQGNGMLARALHSVGAQSHSVQGAYVAMDVEGRGASWCRQHALDVVPEDFEWVAFLDSDDEWMPHHIATLAAAASITRADYVYSWYMIKDPLGRERPDWDFMAENFGKAFDPAAPVQTTITTLVRRELAMAVGFDQVPDGEIGDDGQRRGEDYRFTLGCIERGAKIVHVPDRTWWWHHHGMNTSGMPGRGDA